MYVIVKIMISAILIGIVTEVSRRFPTYGRIIAALPLFGRLLTKRGGQNNEGSRDSRWDPNSGRA